LIAVTLVKGLTLLKKVPMINSMSKTDIDYVEDVCRALESVFGGILAGTQTESEALIRRNVFCGDEHPGRNQTFVRREDAVAFIVCADGIEAPLFDGDEDEEWEIPGYRITQVPRVGILDLIWDQVQSRLTGNVEIRESHYLANGHQVVRVCEIDSPQLDQGETFGR
jgi:hypothetical protein